MKLPSLPALAAVCFAAAVPAHAASILRITEVMSDGDLTDWFELTNYGDTAADLTGFQMDDDSFSVTTAVALNGITSIAPGESVIFTEGGKTNFTSKVAAFKTAWSLGNSIQVGGYGGTGVGLSGTLGDAITVFDSAATELTGPFAGLIRVSFPSATATTGTSFEWLYDATGASISPATGQLTTGGSTYTDAISGVTLRATPGSVPIPETSSILLGAIGAFGLLRRRRA